MISEPDLYPRDIYLNGSRIGKDFRILHQLLIEYNFTNFTFVGPDSASVHSENGLFSESVHHELVINGFFYI